MGQQSDLHVCKALGGHSPAGGYVTSMLVLSSYCMLATGRYLGYRKSVASQALSPAGQEDICGSHSMVRSVVGWK